MTLRVGRHDLSSDIFVVSTDGGKRQIATVNLSPGISVYGERLFLHDGKEYRIWDPFRSKLAAAVLNGLKSFPIVPGVNVLYLGSSTGTTASHISDIVGEKGLLYCVDFAARSMRDFLRNVCQHRVNVSPILADARFPESYGILVGNVQGIYCDVAQPEQARLLSDNARVFLPDGGWTLLAIKARSIDVTRDPSLIFKEELDILRKDGFEIVDSVRLDPYDKAHVMVLSTYE